MKKPTHGGPRRNAGRKTEMPDQTMVRCNFTLDAMTIRKLKVVGEGNLSKGIRLAAAVAFERYQKGK